MNSTTTEAQVPSYLHPVSRGNYEGFFTSWIPLRGLSNVEFLMASKG